MTVEEIKAILDKEPELAILDIKGIIDEKEALVSQYESEKATLEAEVTKVRLANSELFMRVSSPPPSSDGAKVPDALTPDDIISGILGTA